MKPYNVLIFIACVLACLAVLCFVLPGRITLGERELRWLTMAQVMGEEKVSETEEPKREEEAEEEQMPEQEEQEEREEQVAVVVPKVAVDSVTDSRMFLQAFYASLAESGSKVVRVLHYGDSQIEEARNGRFCMGNGRTGTDIRCCCACRARGESGSIER